MQNKDKWQSYPNVVWSTAPELISLLAILSILTNDLRKWEMNDYFTFEVPCLTTVPFGTQAVVLHAVLEFRISDIGTCNYLADWYLSLARTGSWRLHLLFCSNLYCNIVWGARTPAKRAIRRCNERTKVKCRALLQRVWYFDPQDNDRNKTKYFVTWLKKMSSPNRQNGKNLGCQI